MAIDARSSFGPGNIFPIVLVVGAGHSPQLRGQAASWDSPWRRHGFVPGSLRRIRGDAVLDRAGTP